MGSAVENVHHGHGQDSGIAAADIPVQAQPQGIGRRLCNRQGHRQNGIGSQTALVGGTVQLDKQSVDVRLIHGIVTRQSLGNLGVHMQYCLADTLAQIAARIAVAQLAGFINTRGRTAGDRCPTNTAALQKNLRFHRGISAGIQDLTTFYSKNSLHNRHSFVICILYLYCTPNRKIFRDFVTESN